MSEWYDLIDEKSLAELQGSIASELLRHAVGSNPPGYSRQIFANRTLRMERIRTIGFDLDWTLADYDHEAMTHLAFELTLQRLVERFEYPRHVLDCSYRSHFSRRGLMLDTETGMVLKMDRHRYVGRAFHGRSALSREERARLYRSEPIQPASSRFYFVDTLFELPEVNIFSELVELKRQRPDDGSLPAYPELFKHIRAAIDSIHADGTLKAQILSALPRYLPRDPLLPLALQRMAMNGRRLVLITNSEWFYTDGLCSHLFNNSLPGIDHWRDLFALVVVQSGKPGFFRKQRPFIRLDDQGNQHEEVEVPAWGGVYAGGSREGLMRLLESPGEQVLYVGDHIYGDILSSKLTSTWRTALVVKEMEAELETRQSLVSQLRHTEVLRYELAAFGQRMDALRDVLALYHELAQNGGSPKHPRSLQRTRDYLEAMRSEHKVMRQHVRRLQGRISTAINRYWGSLFKQGNNKSLFGSQVDDFACVYTSRVSNFAFYGSDQYYRVPSDAMMHEADR